MSSNDLTVALRALETLNRVVKPTTPPPSPTNSPRKTSVDSSERRSIELSNQVEQSFRSLGKSRYGILAIALLCSVWSTGLIFGWAPLYITLLRNGVYANHCKTSNATAPTPSNVTIPIAPTSSPNSLQTGTSTPLCEEQQKRLNLIYTAGAACAQASLLASGLLLDWIGPKITATITSVVVAVGSLLFAFADLYRVDLYIVSFALMGFGGAGINLTTYTVSNLFPKAKSWVVSALVGVWTLSSLWFLIFKPLLNVGLALHTLFFAQTILLVLTAILFFFTFPNRALREGEIFSFTQWFPWNAWSHSQHQFVDSLSQTIDSNDSELKERMSIDTINSVVEEEGEEEGEESEEEEKIVENGYSEDSDDSDIEIKANIDNEGSEEDFSKKSKSNGNSPEESESNEPNGEKDSSKDSKESNGSGEGFTAEEIPTFGSGKYKFRRRNPSKGLSRDESDMLSVLELPTGDIVVSKRQIVRSGMSVFRSTFRAVLRDVLTVDFVMLTVWFAVLALFFEFFAGTVADALDFRTRQSKFPLGKQDLPASKARTKEVDTYVMVFNFLYAFGFVFVPLYAWTTDKFGFNGTFGLATLMCIIYPLIAALLPWLGASQVISYVIYSAGLQFVYSCQFGFISHRFGESHFGVLVGVMGVFTAALIPLQSALLRLVLNKFKGNFFWAYILQGACCAMLIVIVFLNWIRQKILERRRLKSKDEEEKDYVNQNRDQIVSENTIAGDKASTNATTV